MNNQLAHIFDNSVCLTRRQLRDYVSGHMSSEESHALELHLNSCPLCSEAVEGLQLNPEETVAMLHEMNGDFLQEHFALHTPHVHLNSMAPAASISAANHKKKNKVQPLWRNASIAAALLLSFGLMWYLQAGREKPAPMREVAQNKPAAETRPAENTIAAATTTPPAQTGNTPGQEQPQPIAAANNQNQQSGGSSQKPQLLIGSEKQKAGNGEEKKLADAGPPAAKAAMTEAGGSFADAAPANAGVVQERTERAKSAAPARKQQAIVAAPMPPARRSEDKNSAAAETRKEEAPDADAQYKNGNYAAALNQYNKDINNADESRRHTAMLGAANCYAQQGQKEKAVALLQKIISEGGAGKHSAKVLLRRLNRSQE